jgi:hypothetical protein
MTRKALGMRGDDGSCRTLADGLSQQGNATARKKNRATAGCMQRRHNQVTQVSQQQLP